MYDDVEKIIGCDNRCLTKCKLSSKIIRYPNESIFKNTINYFIIFIYQK